MKFIHTFLAITTGLLLSAAFSSNKTTTKKEREPRINFGRSYKPSEKERRKVDKYYMNVNKERICGTCSGKVKYEATKWCPYCGTIL